MRPAAVALLFLTAALAVGQPPIPPAGDASPRAAKRTAATPEIVGPAEAEYLLTFTVAGVSDKAKVVWDYTPDDTGAAVKVTPCDRSLSLAGPPGTYRVTAFGIDGGEPFILKKVGKITGGKKPGPPTPGPDPEPEPDPAPKPDGALGLRKISRDGAMKVADRAAVAALAGANRSTAAAVAAGAAVKGGRFDAQAALDLWREGNRGSGADPAAWGPWATAASGGLQAAYKGGKLGATAAGWADAFRELADGLDDAGGN